jgi:hypothetical protein
MGIKCSDLKDFVKEKSIKKITVPEFYYGYC